MHLLTIVLVPVFILSGCRGSKQAADTTTQLQQVADEILGKENSIEFNRTRTLALCQETPRPGDHARKQYRFVVVRLKDMVIAEDGTFRMGYIKWLDEDSLELFSGATSGEHNSTKKIIHVNSPAQ